MQLYQQLFRHGKYLRFYLQFSKKEYTMKYLYSCNTVHTVSCVYDKCNYENNEAPSQEKLKSIKPLSNTCDETTEFVKTTNIQSNKKVTFAAKLVNNSPPKIKPYLKLIRLDRPIGKIKVI